MSDLKLGWLSPTGEFTECNSYDHISVAREIAVRLNLPECDFRPDSALMRAGWVYIGISTFMCHEWRIAWERHLTPEQTCFLRPYFEDSTIPVNVVSETRWLEEVGA